MFLAEGATGSFFATKLALANPWGESTNVSIRFTDVHGSEVTTSLLVPAHARRSIDVGQVEGMERREFSTRIDSALPIVVDRTMMWPVGGIYGAHSERALAAPSPVWYFAEGATHSGFDLFYLLQNPASHEVVVQVRYLRPTGLPLEKAYTLPPGSRTNIWVDLEEFPGLGTALANTDVSAVIESNDGTPIIVERAMYLSNQGRLFNAGHESAGVTAPATRWFLAEGATGDFFDMFVLLANPSPADAQAEVTYLLPDGRTYTKTMTVPGNSRQNIWVNYDTPDGMMGHPLAKTAVSTTVVVTNGVPVIVERAMWWPRSEWHEAHNSPGSPSEGTWWGLAEGEVAAGTDTYVLIANTSATPGVVAVTLLFEDGADPVTKVFAVPPTSRLNVVPVVDFPGSFVAGAGRRFATLVESLQADSLPAAQIVVERAMYMSRADEPWAAGTGSLATLLRGVDQSLRIELTGANGLVAFSAETADCSVSCTRWFREGIPVTLTAVPDAGAAFAGWSGETCSGTGTCTVAMNAARAVTASFVPLRTLTVAKTGTGSGTITSLPSGIACGATCTAPFADATIVTLTAVPDAGSAFAGWSGACAGAAATCTVLIGAANSVTASFKPPWSLTVVPGPGLSVLVSPGSKVCQSTCTTLFDRGVHATITPQGAWATTTSTVCGVDDCTVTLDITMATYVVTSSSSPWRLSVTNNFGVAVTSTPSGIDCPGNCVADFTVPSIQLRAPAGPYYPHPIACSPSCALTFSPPAGGGNIRVDPP